jgi:osmoprotectant transport system ATP-binding protein
VGFGVIEFESVGKTFRDGTAAVVDLNLTVPSDKITVIVGPSGCGKTTTLRMVNRMLEPTTGRISWDGTPLRTKRKTTLRRQMGYVIQSGGLFPHRTVLDNIGTVPSLLRWPKKKIEKRAFELLDSVGLERKLAQRYPVQLSGGQQQRVGVARALAADPLVMLMDEPFSAVDPVVRSELHEFFLGLQRELSKTIILITHDIDEAIKLGDQVAIMRVGGHLAQVGTPQQLLDEPADAFVEGFVGRDRGFRSLSFQSASVLSLDRVKVVRDVETARGPAPILVVDGDARPVGWADPDRPGRVFPLGATFSPERDSLRGALDSALTSRYGLAVAVTGDTGRYAGVLSADTILDKVKDVRTSIADSIAIREAEAAREFELLEEPDGAEYEPLGDPEYEYESDDESAEVPEAQDEHEAEDQPARYESEQYESEQYEHESAQYESAQHESAQHESAQQESAQQESTQDESVEEEPAQGYGTEGQRTHDDGTEWADSYAPSLNGPGSMSSAPVADTDAAEVNADASQTAVHAPPDVEVQEDRRGSIDAEKPESIIESASDRTVPIEDHQAALRNHEGWDAIGKAWDRRGSGAMK